MRKLKRKLTTTLPAAFSLFIFLFAVHAAPFSHAIFHALVHEKGIHHSHAGAPADHSQQDHNLGDVQDPMLVSVSVIADGATRSAQIFGSVLPVFFAAQGGLPEPEPPSPRHIEATSSSPPDGTAARLLSSPLRAPPSA